MLASLMAALGVMVVAGCAQQPVALDKRADSAQLGTQVSSHRPLAPLQKSPTALQLAHAAPPVPQAASLCEAISFSFSINAGGTCSRLTATVYSAPRYCSLCPF